MLSGCITFSESSQRQVNEATITATLALTDGEVDFLTPTSFSESSQRQVSEATITATLALTDDEVDFLTPTPLATKTDIPSVLPTVTPTSLPASTPTLAIIVSSPNEMVQQINEKGHAAIRQIWQQLDIEDTASFFDNNTKLGASLLDLKITEGNKENYVMLSISDTSEFDWQYLIFRLADEKWQFLGTLNFSSQKYLLKPHKYYRIIERDGQDLWLVLQWQSGSGTGYSRAEETWYKIDGKQLEKVLEYPISGSGYAAQLSSIDFEGKVLDYGEQKETYEVELSFRFRYWNSYPDYSLSRSENILFEDEKTVYYVLDYKTNKFELEVNRSELTDEQVGKLFVFSDWDFAEYHYDELVNLALNGDAKQKGWLKDFLDNVKIVRKPERTLLLRMLEDQQ